MSAYTNTYNQGQRQQSISQSLKPAAHKSIIKVEAFFNTDGSIQPVAIYWGGRRYTVDSVIDCRRCVSLKTGGGDYRYTCIIKGKERFLFREFDPIKDKYYWFVVEERPEPQDYAE